MITLATHMKLDGRSEHANMPGKRMLSFHPTTAGGMPVSIAVANEIAQDLEVGALYDLSLTQSTVSGDTP